MLFRSDVYDLLTESLEGLTRVKNIVQSLKDFSRVGESGWQLADLHKGLESTLELSNATFKDRITVQKRYGDLPLVKCLASELNQVFMSLVANAAYAIGDSGAITIETGRSGDWVSLRFSDAGCGIAADQLNRIFDPFYTTKPVGSGAGLGLSLSFGIVQKHRGRIEVASTSGAGSTFTIWLPLDPEQPGSDNPKGYT